MFRSGSSANSDRSAAHRTDGSVNLKKAVPDIECQGRGINTMSEEKVKSPQPDNQMDSGFMSGSNLISSSSLCSSDDIGTYHRSSSSNSKHLENEGTRNTKEEGYDKTNTYSENLDSGIIDEDLSEGMSSINLNSGPINSTPETPPPEELNPPPENRSRTGLAAMGLSPAHIAILREIFKKDSDGDTQLHVAVMRGFVEAVWQITRLLPHQALLDIPNNTGRTALHLAVASGDSRLARHLIVCGASPVAKNRKGETPLHIACRSGDPNMVTGLTGQVTVYEVVSARLLYPPNHTPGLLAADLNNYDGQTCIHIAAQHSHKAILQQLSWYGADINAKEGKCGRTALHFAVEARDMELVRFLADSCRAALSIQTYAGLTPYQLALANDVPTIASLLEDLGANKEPLPSTFAADDDLDYEEESTQLGGESDLSWQMDDLRIGVVPLQYTNAVPVSTQGPFNADPYL